MRIQEGYRPSLAPLVYRTRNDVVRRGTPDSTVISGSEHRPESVRSQAAALRAAMDTRPVHRPTPRDIPPAGVAALRRDYGDAAITTLADPRVKELHALHGSGGDSGVDI